MFFWARVVYFGVYLAGIKVLRTVVWAVSIAGLVMILMASHPAGGSARTQTHGEASDEAEA